MTIRNLGTTLRDSLLNNEEFNYAHLVKFEKPSRSESQGSTSRKAHTYSYISDSAFDIYWNDDSKDAQGTDNGPQTYYANKLVKVGSTSETTEAKASNLNIVLDSSALGASTTTNTIAWSSEKVTLPAGIDLIDAGFREGDKIYFTESTNTELNKHANHKAYVIIKKFESPNVFTYTPIGTVANVSVTNLVWTLSLASEEITSLIVNKESATTYTSYLNREVFIYKAHLRVEAITIGGTVHPAGSIIGKPYLLFKGIITSGSITEDPNKASTVSWSLSSHWGDFSRVAGRLTVDEAHRALDGGGNADLDAVIRPEYAGDLGFVHANQSLNVMALYNDIEIEYEQVDINGGWFGGKRIREVEVEVERRTDLAFNLSPKYLPVVYGIQKIDSIPVFVDTSNDNAAEIYVAYAMCEGPVAGLLDIYLDGSSNICVDEADEDLRAGGGEAVDLKCYGRMDRGDTLKGYNSNTGSFDTETNALLGDWATHGESNGANWKGLAVLRKFRLQNYNSNDTAVDTTLDTSTGLLHEQTHTITSPINGHLQFHQGLADQRANPTLVNKASETGTNSGFKIQNDYFTGKKGEYWGGSHQLLDTAYTVAKFTIAAGETSIPELKFIVRGKMLDCHNYDRSYNNTSVASSGHALFRIGQTVSLRVSASAYVNNNDSTASSVTIIDKWSFLDDKGVKQYRFITDYNKNIESSHYMQLSTDSSIKWYMAPSVSTSDLTSTVSAAVKATVSSSSAASGGGLNVVVVPPAVFEAGIAASISAEANGAIAFSGVNRTELENGLLTDITYNASNNTLSGVGSGTTVTSLNSSVTTVFVKDAIALNSTHANGTNGYYIGQSITLTRFDAEGVPHIQQKTITAYSTTGNVAIVDSTWDAGYLPDAGDSYTISAGKPDKRVSINPAIQLLDYLTSKRYGRGLDINQDIDLETFKEAARDCDTPSTVMVLCPNSVTVVADEKYEYAPDGILHFRGTVASAAVPRSIDGITYKEVVFKDVIGKLGHKFNTWEAIAAKSLIWHEGSLHTVVSDSAAGYTIDSTNSTTSLSLNKVGGGTSLVLDLSKKSANGNPLVKKWVPNSPLSSHGSAIGSGYSLYDADDIKYWKYIGWDSNKQRNVTRHQMNQTVSTSNPIFDNINLMLKQFNGILRYSNGKYQLSIKARSPDTYAEGETINEGDIIGPISLKDGGAKKTYNSVSTSIKDPHNKFESRSVSFFNSNYLKQDKNIPKKGSYGLPGITNYFNARFNINQMLDESRYGLTVSFKMMPKGYLLLPGNIIQLNYPRFGWSNKLFRINSLAATADCLVNLTATEHNNDAYVIGNLAKPGVGSEIEIGGPRNRDIPTAPDNLTASTNTKGAINLAWDNASDYNPANYTTNIHYATSNDRTHSSFKLLGTTDADEYSHVVTDQSTQTFYYWVRHRTVKDNGDLLHSDYHPTSETAGVQGSATGAIDGNSPLGATLIANQYVIPYNSADDESTTIVLTATSFNFETGNRRYRFYINNSATPSSDITTTNDSQAFTLPPASEPANGAQTTVKVSITQSSNTVEDSASIYGIKDGVNAFTVILTNEAHVIPGNEVGEAITYANSGTDIRVFHGSTRLTNASSGANTFSVAAAPVSITAGNASTTTFTNTNDTASFDVASSMANADTSASITYTITARDSALVATVLTKVQTFTKGTAGLNAKIVNLTASKYVIPYDVDGGEDTEITFTATSKNIAGTKIYKFYVDNSIKQTTSSSSDSLNYVLLDGDEPANGTQKTIRVDIEAPSGTVVASDSTSIYGIKDGSDAFTVILTNEAHVIPATSAGVPRTYANSGTDIRVFLGSTALAYNTSGANTFNVTATSGNDIDPNASPSTVSTYTRRYGIAGGMLNNAFADFITYTIVARNGEGTATTFTKIQSFTKGNDGVDADALTITSNTITNGIRTLAFSDGESLTINGGLNTSTVALYKKSTSNSTAPADPAGNAGGSLTYTFADGAVTGGNLSGWATAVPDLSNEEYAWVILATASSRNETDSIPVGEFSTAVVHSGGGETGIAGNSNALVSLYRVSTSGSTSPTSFTGTITYTFNGGGVTTDGNFNSWTTSVPAVPKGSYLWIRQGTVSSNGLTATIAIGNWSGAAIASSGGIDGIDNGVVAVYADNADGLNKAFIQGTKKFVNFLEWTSTKPGLTDTRVTSLTVFVKAVGEDGDAEGVIPVYSTNASGTGKSFSITDSNFTDREYVNFYEWSETKPDIGDSRITALNTFVKFVGTSFKTVEIFKLNDTSVGGNAANQTYATPLAGLETNWSTTQPALVTNGDKVYMSRRTFTEDNLTASGNEIAWSAPVVVAERNDSTVPGPTGLRSIQGYLYYQKSTGTLSDAPDGPISGSQTISYSFGTGLVTGPNISNGVINKWSNEPMTNVATSTNTHWAVRYYGVEASSGSSSVTIPVSQVTSAVQSTVFTGVVTFNGGTLTDGSGSGDITPLVDGAGVAAAVNAGTTTIDGGLITADSINADRLAIGELNRTTDRLLLLQDSLKIFSGSALRVHIGNLSNTSQT